MFSNKHFLIVIFRPPLLVSFEKDQILLTLELKHLVQLFSQNINMVSSEGSHKDRFKNPSNVANDVSFEL